MALSTFDELKSSIAGWLNWEDIDTRIPDFITLAESRFNRDLDHWQMETSDTITANAQYEDLPTGFLAPVRLSLGSTTYAPLRLVSVHVMQEMREANGDSSGRPEYYAVTGGQFEFYPTPDTDYAVNVIYRQAITALSDADPSNWILTSHPGAYLYGALMQSAPYLAEDERIQVWAALYANEVQAINLEGERAKFGGAKVKRIRSA